MVFDLFNNEVGAFARRQDVLSKIHRVDGFPDLRGRLPRFRNSQVGIAMKVRRRILENGLLESQEAVYVPLPDMFFLRVDED